MNKNMGQQVFVIHGGNAFDTYEEFLKCLKEKEASLARLKEKRWKERLEERLGQDFAVFIPLMPNAQNAKYVEWKIWFEKLIPLMNDNVVLVGHSLGGIFLAKYLSENLFTKTIRGTFLVAAPFNTPLKHPDGDFILLQDLRGLAEQGGEIFIYQSKDDETVPCSNGEAYQKALPSAHFRDFTNRGHFVDKTFPELEEDIRSLSHK